MGLLHYSTLPTCPKDTLGWCSWESNSYPVWCNPVFFANVMRMGQTPLQWAWYWRLLDPTQVQIKSLCDPIIHLSIYSDYPRAYLVRTRSPVLRLRNSQDESINMDADYLKLPKANKSGKIKPYCLRSFKSLMMCFVGLSNLNMVVTTAPKKSRLRKWYSPTLKGKVST